MEIAEKIKETEKVGITKKQKNEDVLLYLKNKYQAKENNADYVDIINLWDKNYRINFYGKKIVNKTDNKETEGCVIDSLFVEVEETPDGYMVKDKTGK